MKITKREVRGGFTSDLISNLYFPRVFIDKTEVSWREVTGEFTSDLILLNAWSEVPPPLARLSEVGAPLTSSY